MPAIASTSGTTLCLVMSTCSIALARYSFFFGLAATMHLLMGEPKTISAECAAHKTKNHHGPLRCTHENSHGYPPLRAGVALNVQIRRSVFLEIVTLPSRRSSDPSQFYSRAFRGRSSIDG